MEEQIDVKFEIVIQIEEKWKQVVFLHICMLRLLLPKKLKLQIQLQIHICKAFYEPLDSDETFIGVEKIFEDGVGIKNKSNEIVFKPLEDLMEELAFAVCLAPENLSEGQLHWPFHDKSVRQNFVKYILRSKPEFKQWLEKYCGVHLCHTFGF